MTLELSQSVQSPLKLSVVKVLWYEPGTFNRTYTPTENNGLELLAELNSVTQTSDASVGECVFSIDDPLTAFLPKNTRKVLHIPEIGDEIAVVASSVGSGNTEVLFKGSVIDVSHNRNDTGSIYGVRCTDMKSRLAEVIVTKSYNEIYRIASRPNFSEKDRQSTPFEAREWTVKKIIEDLLDTANKHVIDISHKYLPLTYFELDDFVYDEVDDLEDFITGVLKFENISLLEAIYRTISSAGTYRMIYDQRRDNIVFTRLSTKADEAGEKRFIKLATSDKNSPNEDYVYENGINVISDNSSRRTNDLASIFRMFSARIEWYSGHFYISDTHADYDMDTPNKESVYYLTNRNWDGYKYHAPMYSLGDFLSNEEVNDFFKDIYSIVGCPLYPQWNPLAGYDPFEITMHDTIGIKDGETLDKDTKLSDPKYKTVYDGDKEYEGFTELDMAFPQGKSFKEFAGGNNLNVALGYTYEAWYPWHGVCAYCNGSGAVESVPDSWKDNFEEWFGNSRTSNGTPNKPYMSPFNYSFDYTTGKPKRHPVPWKNTCPACRGNGREPRFKITNILNSFMAVSPDKKKIANASQEESVQMTWDQMVQDLSTSFGPKIQMEKFIDSPACKAKDDDTAPRHSLADTKTKSGPSTLIFPVTKKRPLNDKISEIYYTQIEINSQASIDHKRGNVVFSARQCIPCKKPTRSIKTEYDTIKKSGRVENIVYYIKDEKGETQYSDQMLDPRQVTFWRPARAWISCFFARERFFDDFDVRGNPQDIKFENPDEDKETYYRCALQVWDGRAVYELKDKYPDDDTEFDIRPVIKGYTGEEFRWQISPDDMYKFLMPDTDRLDWGDEAPKEDGDNNDPDQVDNNKKPNLRDRFISHNYFFSEAAVHDAEPLRWSEAKALGDNIDKSAIMRSNLFGKPVRWLMKDDRFKLIERAVKELERRNNIQITGNMILRGYNFDLRRGFGYVQFDDGLRACIVKIEHNFGNGTHLTTIELSTEEMRIGKEREKDLDYKRQMENKISELYTSQFDNNTSASGTENSTGKNHSYDPSHIVGGVQR